MKHISTPSMASCSKLHHYFILFSLTFFLVMTGVKGWGQSFLGLNGGFEGSTIIDNTNVQTSAQAGKWTKNNASTTIADETSLVRSGGHSLSTTNSSTTGRRIWTPLITVSSTTSQVTLQYFRRAASNSTNYQSSQSGVGDGTTSNENTTGSYSGVTNVNTWEKVTYTRSSWTYTNIAGVLFTRMNGTGTTYMYFDDVCMYVGAVDNTAPTSPGAVTVAQNSTYPTTKLDVSWGAVSGGLDNGGGYLVVRYTGSAPVAADDPNVNGIYAVGNTITVTNTGTVAYVGTNTSFTDDNNGAGLTPGTTYYYKVYTYDKAYNYSSEYSNTGTAGSTATGNTPTKLVITSISPASPIVNTAFSVTVQSQDESGNAAVVTSATNILLSVYSGNGSLSNNTGTIAYGTSTVVLSGVTYSVSETGVIITASPTSGMTGLTPGNSSSFTVLAAVPSAATVLTIGTRTVNSIGVSWINGDGAGRIVVARTVAAVAPTAGTAYSVNSTSFVDPLNSTTGTGNVVVYNGTGNSVTVTGLSAATGYYFDVYEYNGSTGTYNYSVATSSSLTYTLSTEPTGQASSVGFSNVTASAFTISWTSGSGSSRIVVMKSGSAVDSPPTDGTAYTANAAFGSGNTTGTNNYVVYNGNGTSVNVTNLTSGTTYYIALYEYNGTSTTCNYLTPSTAIGSQITNNDAIILNAIGTAVTEDFNTLANSGTSSILPVGWAYTESGSSANSTYTAGTGSSATGDTYSFGDLSSSERALGGLQSGNLIPTFGAKIRNNTGTTLNTIKIAYTGETWRVGTASRSDRIDFQYSTNATSLTTGSWTDLNALDYANPGQATGSGSLQHSAAISSAITSLSLANNNIIWIRWNDFDASSSDDGMAVDDLSITPCADLTAPTSASASVNPLCSGNSTSLSLSGGSVGATGAIIRWYTSSCGGTLAGTGNNLSVSPTSTTTYYGRCENACGDATACASITVTVNQSVTPSVTIVASANPVTSGTSVAITATPVNGGTTPLYQFYVNATAFGPQTDNPSFSFAPPAGSYDIYVVMTPDPGLPCFSPATATSNTINLVVTASPATSTWTGNGNDQNWHNADNWDNGVPGSTTAVTIPSGLLTNYPTVSSSAMCASITIMSGASLINNGLLGITPGPATVKRVIADASDDKWHLFISPITQNIAATASSCFNGAYLDRYDEPSGAWVRLATGDNVVPDYGYSINYLSGSRELVFTGTFKNSPLTYSNLSYSSGAPGYGAGWHLIGNPYPCGINPSLCAAPSGMNAFAYVWNTGSGNYLTPQFGFSATVIAPLQGFFVKTTSATNSLTLANNAKTHGGTFYKNDNVESEALVVKISGNNYSDQSTVRFNSDATAGFDQSYDAYKLWGLDEAPQLYSILPDENAAVNTLPAIDNNPLVPLGLKVGAETSYILTFEGMDSFDPQVPLRLDDLKLGISKDLRTDPVYSFTAAPGDAENRFRLRFASAIGFEDPEASNILINSERNVIRINYMGSATGTIHLYNNAGQLLSAKSLSQGETTMSAEATGIYLVKVITGKSVVTKKVVVVR